MDDLEPILIPDWRNIISKISLFGLADQLGRLIAVHLIQSWVMVLHCWMFILIAALSFRIDSLLWKKIQAILLDIAIIHSIPILDFSIKKSFDFKKQKFENYPFERQRNKTINFSIQTERNKKKIKSITYVSFWIHIEILLQIESLQINSIFRYSIQLRGKGWNVDANGWISIVLTCEYHINHRIFNQIHRAINSLVMRNDSRSLERKFSIEIWTR